jgi:hypothetical protein
MGGVLRAQQDCGGREKSNLQLLREPQGLSVPTLKSWQSTLLDDPKNKSVNPRARASIPNITIANDCVIKDSP